MKFKTTKKAIMNSYDNIISVGYCNLQSLLSCEEPIAYICGGEGWKADIYDFSNVAIVTGYQPFGNIKTSYEFCKPFETEARKTKETDYDYSSVKSKLEKIINDFIAMA
jgi:hypothetical protein